MAKTKETLSKNQFDSLIDEIKGELDQLLKTEEDKEMAKTAPGQESPSEDDDNADVSATAPAAPAMGAEEGSTPGTDGAEASAPAPDASAAPAPEGVPGEDGDAAADTGMDHGALVAEYSKLPIEELKMHMLAAKEALMNAMGGDAGSEEPAAPAAPAPMAPPPAPEASMSASAPPTLKGEMKADHKANGGPVPSMKSETSPAMEALQKTVAAQEEALGKLVQTVEFVLSQPTRKAITSVGFIPKTESAPKSLSKSEVNEKLVTITRSPKLSKSDRELINEYCLGNLSVEKIEHLLK